MREVVAEIHTNRSLPSLREEAASLRQDLIENLRQQFEAMLGQRTPAIGSTPQMTSKVAESEQIKEELAMIRQQLSTAESKVVAASSELGTWRKKQGEASCYSEEIE